MEVSTVSRKESGALCLNPLVKVLLLCMISVLTMSGTVTGWQIYPRLFLGILPAVLLFFVDKKSGFWQGGVFFLSWLGDSFLVPQMSGAGGLILMMICGIVTRFLPTLVMGSYLLKTTLVESLIASFEKVHVPTMFTLPFAVMLRFFPTIREENAGICDAMRLRGVTGKMLLTDPIKYIEYRLVPLMSIVVKSGDDLTAAALTKGLGGEQKRTHYFASKWGAWDLVVLSAAAAAVISYCLI